MVMYNKLDHYCYYIASLLTKVRIQAGVIILESVVMPAVCMKQKYEAKQNSKNDSSENYTQK